MGSQSDFMRHVSSAIVELRLFTIRAALAWIWCREFSAEGEQFPHTEIPYVTLGIIDLKYISPRNFLGRILILFNAPTFCVKCFFTESMCMDHVSLLSSCACFTFITKSFGLQKKAWQQVACTCSWKLFQAALSPGQTVLQVIASLDMPTWNDMGGQTASQAVTSYRKCMQLVARVKSLTVYPKPLTDPIKLTPLDQGF